MPSDSHHIDGDDEVSESGMRFQCLMRRETGRPKSRNLVVDGRRTSMRLEDTMWDALLEIATRESLCVGDLCTSISRVNAGTLNLTSAVRTFIAAYFRESATEEGHLRAGHGPRPEREEAPTTN